MEQEKEDFRKVLSDILQNLPRICNEKDLRKAYREQEGQNINKVIDKLDAVNLYTFLRFQCRDFCDVYKNDGEVKVQRIDLTAPAENQQKSHKKKTSSKAPKLNYPLVNQARGKRANPQGFNKKKYVEGSCESKEVESSVPHYNNSKAVYRSAEQLSKFYQRGDSDEDCALPYPSCYYKGSSTNLFAENELPIAFSEVVSFPPDIEKPAKESKKTPEKPPSVQNPFEFPNLPVKKDEKAGKLVDSRDFQDDSEHSEEESSEEEYHRVCRLDRISLDHPIFKAVYPEIVTDPQVSFPRPTVKTLYSKLMFNVHITTVDSPWQFWFRYGDESLNILVHRMNNFYDEIPDIDLMIPTENIQPGLAVAVKLFDIWYRARVVTGNDEKNEVCLFFVDFGTEASVHVSNIRYLLKFFAADPVKALRGCLLGVCPKNYETFWSSTARQAFFHSIANKKLFAVIKFYRQENDIFDVDLYEKAAIWPSIAEQLILSKFADREHNEDNVSFAVPMSYSSKT